HLHVLVHLAGAGKLGLRLLVTPYALVERAEAEVTVGRERPRTELLGQGERLAVVALGLVGLWRVAVGGDLAQEAQRPGLVAAFLVVTGEIQSASGDMDGFIYATGPQVALAEIGQPERRGVL